MFKIGKKQKQKGDAIEEAVGELGGQIEQLRRRKAQLEVMATNLKKDIILIHSKSNKIKMDLAKLSEQESIDSTKQNEISERLKEIRKKIERLTKIDEELRGV